MELESLIEDSAVKQSNWSYLNEKIQRLPMGTLAIGASGALLTVQTILLIHDWTGDKKNSCEFYHQEKILGIMNLALCGFGILGTLFSQSRHAFGFEPATDSVRDRDRMTSLCLQGSALLTAVWLIFQNNICQKA